MENSKVIFKKGDVVQAKKEWLAEYETQESTMGIVVDYNEENDYLQAIFNGRGCCYELVKIGEAEK